MRAETATSRVGRDGMLRLELERRGARTVMAGCRWTLPLQILAPVAVDDEALVLSLLNPTGGLVGGDRLDLAVSLGPGARACLTTPSATKVYRTAGEAARQDVRLRVGLGAMLEWVPDHTIAFAGSVFRQRIEVGLAPGARLILVDAFAAGRIARDEAWRFDRLESAVIVRDAVGEVFYDRLVLRGGAGLERLGCAEGCPYFATMAVIGDADLEPFRRATTASLAARGDVSAGVGALSRGGVVLRLLAGDAPALIAAIDAAWAAARAALAGAPPLALRKL
ncbi:MAG TPA: urease accessory protein UreD [Methylomirabilota bacterium]|nr:urease accessory protein UreD [Methylomirabilota bacterium]